MISAIKKKGIQHVSMIYEKYATLDVIIKEVFPV